MRQHPLLECLPVLVAQREVELAVGDDDLLPAGQSQRRLRRQLDLGVALLVAVDAAHRRVQLEVRVEPHLVALGLLVAGCDLEAIDGDAPTPMRTQRLEAAARRLRFGCRQDIDLGLVL
eukprot:4420567-Prymnesium_polylepis.1